MKYTGKVLTIFMLIISIRVTSCDSNEGSTGTLKLSLTDAPLDNPDIVAVNLSVGVRVTSRETTDGRFLMILKDRWM